MSTAMAPGVPPEEVTRRYHLLIDALGAEMGHARGWVKKVADRVGVHPSYISKLRSDSSAQVGARAVDRACERLGMSNLYFFEEWSGGDVPWTEYDHASSIAKNVAAEVMGELQGRFRQIDTENPTSLADVYRTAEGLISSPDDAGRRGQLVNQIVNLSFVQQAVTADTSAMTRQEARRLASTTLDAIDALLNNHPANK